MSEPASDNLSSHTVAELKVMCKANGLSVSGRKAEIIVRLDEHLNEESISLEEAETVPLPIVKEKAKPKPKVEEEKEEEEEEEEILIAEVIEAEVIDDVEEITPVLSKDKSSPATLFEQIKNPKIAAVLITILLASGGWYWYANAQLQPFTADDLRYGDSMEYTILNGDLDATGEYVELLQDYIETEELNNSCRVQLEFSGTGTTSVTNGDANELAFESDNSLLGAVQAKGAYGLDWLTVEKVQTRNFDSFSTSRYHPNPLSGKCMNQPSGGLGGTLQFDTKSWTEISERDVISTQADWIMNLGGDYSQGTTMSYGLGGILGLLEEAAPGVAIVISPIEIHDMMGSQLIDTGTNGTHLGWEWNVVGPDEIGDEEMWKVSLENRQIRDNCFGHARITMWVIEDSPWAVKQNVDVQISGDEGDKSSCGTISEKFADLILPEGSLSLSLEMSKNTLTRGDKLLDLGRSYSSTPNAGAYVPTSGELIDWGRNETHLPDNSGLRSETLEDAITCLSSGFVSEAVAANSALNDDGYIWRARDDRSNQSGATRWNLSWVSADPNSGWVVIDVLGNPSSTNCEYVEHGGHDETVSHSRNDIPSALNISMLELDLIDSTRYPALSGVDGFFTSVGEYHPETRIGILVVTPDSEYTDWLSRLNSGDTGATTLDLTRSWISSKTIDGETTEWDSYLSLVMDATNGQVIGWNLLETPL
jgi:hypothetical protein